MTLLTGDFAAECSVRGEKGESGTDRAEPGRLNEDALYYLRHVEGGESIRSLAREAGCHASTILRRIRRVEARRDDPLIDRALERAGATALSKLRVVRTEQRAAEETRRVLRRLAESGAQLAVAEGMEKAIVTRDDIRTAILDRSLAEQLALDGWVSLVASGRITRYAITSAGRDALRAMLAGHPAPLPRRGEIADAAPVSTSGMAEAAAGFDHAARHPRLKDGRLPDPETGRMRRVRINLSESPLQILARRRNPDGTPFLTPEMVAAGERLREDFELAQMGPRLAQNWERFMTAGIDASRQGPSHAGGSETARSRVAAALRELGPGMGDLVLRVCCFLEGIEATERRLGWAARSGKVVLRLALMRLMRHYRDAYGPGTPMIG